MANYFWKHPVDHGDNNLWGPKAAEIIQSGGIGANTCYLYDDSGTLKVSTGHIGISDGTVIGCSNIDTVTTISIAGVSNGNWAEVYMSVSGTSVTFAAIDISGATTETTIPTDFLNAFSTVKNGYYINAARRCIGIIWKTSGGALSHIINAHYRTTRDIFAGGDDGLYLRDNAGNPWMSFQDGGKHIGIGHTDVESWDSGFFAFEAPKSAISLADTGAINLTWNAYYDGSWKFKSSDTATRVSVGGTAINFYFVSSGTIDNAITWVKAAEIGALGMSFAGAAGGSDRDYDLFFTSGNTVFAWRETSNEFLINASLVPGGSVSGIIDLGDAATYWDEVHCCDVIDESAFYIPDIEESYNLIKNLENEETEGFCKKCEKRGQKRLKYSQFPEHIYKNGLIEAKEDIIFNKSLTVNKQSFINRNIDIPVFKNNEVIVRKGEKSRYVIKKSDNGKELFYTAEGMSYTGIISTLLGTVKKLIQEVEILKGTLK